MCTPPCCQAMLQPNRHVLLLYTKTCCFRQQYILGMAQFHGLTPNEMLLDIVVPTAVKTSYGHYS